MGSALRREDLIWSRTQGYQQRVNAALEAVRRAVEIGPIGVAFSGGKDSTCVLDIVRRVVPDAPAAFFDSGCELESTHEMVRAVGAHTIAPRLSMPDMARYAGWWGYEQPVDKGCPFDAKRVVIEEPSETFVVRWRLRAVAHGVRAQESKARRRHSSRGSLYQGADRTWYCMPVIRWRIEDVWAYIASRDLAYNRAYDLMSDAGVPREHQRVATLMVGGWAEGFGAHVIHRRIAPEQWRRLVAEFPLLGLVS